MMKQNKLHWMMEKNMQLTDAEIESVKTTNKAKSLVYEKS